VKDKAGKKHDIVVLGHNVAQVRMQTEAYGAARRRTALRCFQPVYRAFCITVRPITNS
jgi:hypothetical protein